MLSAKKLLSIAIIGALTVVSSVVVSQSPMHKLLSLAESGDVAAQAELGAALIAGIDTAQDVDGGVLWLVKASEAPKGSALAAFLLAEHYERQSATPNNRSMMAQYYRRAAVLGNTTAQAKLGKMLLGSATDTRLSEKARTEAAEKGRAILEHAANAGQPRAAVYLAEAYRHGDGLALDPVLAMRFERRAADLGDVDAAMLLTRVLLDAKSSEFNPDQGIAYLRQAANAGHVLAMSELARRLQSGDHVSKDLFEAKEWASRAAEEGDSPAMSLLAMIRESEPAPQPAKTMAMVPAEDSVIEEPLQAVASPASVPEPSQDEQFTLAFDVGDSDQPVGGCAEDEEQRRAVLRLQETVEVQQKDIVGLRAEVEIRGRTINDLTLARDQAIAQVLDLQKPVLAPVAKRVEKAAPAFASAPQKSASEINDQGLSALRAGDASRALRWFEAAAKEGHTGAMNNLAMLHLQGRGTRPSITSAIEHFTHSAELGNGVAANNLGYLYQTGREGVTANRATAITWYQRAVQLGHKASGRQLQALGAAPNEIASTL